MCQEIDYHIREGKGMSWAMFVVLRHEDDHQSSPTLHGSIKHSVTHTGAVSIQLRFLLRQ
jgi:hypothetical protein